MDRQDRSSVLWPSPRGARVIFCGGGIKNKRGGIERKEITSRSAWPTEVEGVVEIKMGARKGELGESTIMLNAGLALCENRLAATLTDARLLNERQWKPSEIGSQQKDQTT